MKISNPTVTGIIETKTEVSIDRYCVIPRDRNRKGWSLICYVTNKRRQF